MDNKNTKILKFYNIINVICYPKLEIRKTCKLLLKSIKKNKKLRKILCKLKKRLRLSCDRKNCRWSNCRENFNHYVVGCK